MKNGWTGGQYSLVRTLFGLALAVAFLQHGVSLFEPASSVVLALACGTSLLVAVGWHDRLAALLLAGVAANEAHAAHAMTAWPFVALALLAHACTPSAPFGSWAALGRTDPRGPRGSWRMPEWVFTSLWLAMLAGYAYSAATRGPMRSRACDVVGVGLCFAPFLRPYGWTATLAVSAARVALSFEPVGLDAGLLVLHAFTLDPRWIPARHPMRAAERVYYDGECGLCHRFVRFVLAEDARGAFRFAPLQGETFRRGVAPETDLPDSVVVQSQDGLLARSNAVIHVFERLGGIWRALAILARCVPWRLRDRAYDACASVRRTLFRAPTSACPTLPPDVVTRFDP